jgi:hypothetical protein
MINKENLKKSDKKKYEEAWMNFYKKMAELIVAVKALEEIPNGEFSVDDLNQICTRIEKLTKTILRIGESIN